jgi:hypothetical protein
MAYDTELQTPTIAVEAGTPVQEIKSEDLRKLGGELSKLFTQYVSDRQLVEQQWMKNLRQYRGIYDPEALNEIGKKRSQAYPRITRVKCISVLSRVMNLMFPGNERNWELTASPSADMDPRDIQQAVVAASQRDQEAGVQVDLTPEYVQAAVQRLADERAKKLSVEIDDMLQELGGDQTNDYIALNRRVVKSGIQYGIGVLRGPFVRTVTKTSFQQDPTTGAMVPQVQTLYKPQFEVTSCWDFYPDMSAKSMSEMDGYFVRVVMGRAQLRKLADRPDFFGQSIRRYLKDYPQGNYKAQSFEAELRALGSKAHVLDIKAEGKYEIIVWHGPVSGEYLRMAGVAVSDDQVADDLDAEIWMVGECVIKADINPWKKLGVDVRTLHTFLFDEDDTSPVGEGLPSVMRDSQLAVSAAARMLLDNASVTCGPNIEVNTALMRADQDLTSVEAYKIWYREDDDITAQFPAVRNVPIDGHMPELTKIIELFMAFADAETFVGPATGGDMEKKGMGEPMRTAAGASMLRGDAALPFKDIIRNFDTFTQSVISSLVAFQRKFNPDPALAGDYNVVARGASSLIAKEVRGMQVDNLALSLTPEERMHIDERKFVEARFATRDLQNLMVPEDEAKRRQMAAQQSMQKQQDQQNEMIAAEIRKTLTDSYKNIAQAQKNSAGADATAVKSATDLLGQIAEGDDNGKPQAGGAKPARPAAGKSSVN